MPWLRAGLRALPRGIHFPAWVKGVKTTHWKFFSWQLGGGQEGKPNLRGTLQAFAPDMYADISLVKATSHWSKQVTWSNPTWKGVEVSSSGQKGER